jgi:hypothetical protein
MQPPIPYRPVPPMAVPSSGSATASMVLGIIGVVFGWCTFGLPCVLAVIFGHVGYMQTKDGLKSGKGLAVAGLVLGYVMLVPGIVLTILVVLGELGSTTT